MTSNIKKLYIFCFVIWIMSVKQIWMYSCHTADSVCLQILQYKVMFVLNLCWFMTVDYNSVLHQCLSAGHINNYWQNSSCQIKVTDGRWGAASHSYNPAYHRPHLIIPKSLLNIKQTPFITAHSSTTGCMHQEKCQREALFTLSIRCHECFPLTSGVPSTAGTFAVGSTGAVTPKNELPGEKVHVAATNKDLFTLFKGLCCWQKAGKFILESNFILDQKRRHK